MGKPPGLEAARALAARVGSAAEGATLSMELAGGSSRRVALAAGRALVVGRKGKKRDIEIAHASVSSKHAAVVAVSAEEVVLVDLGSSFGTRVNGTATPPGEQTRLRPGDRILFGNCPDTFTLEPAAEARVGPTVVVPPPEAAAAAAAAAAADDGPEPEMSREERQAAIAALAAEMTSTSAKASVDDVMPPQAEEKAAAVVLESQAAIPARESVSMLAHTRGVCALAVDPAGGRFASGGRDFNVALWDFGGMTSEHKPFHQFAPVEGVGVRALDWSPSGGALLLVPADSRARVLDRDGATQETTVKGDPYLHDMSKTKGHPSMATGGCWLPDKSGAFLTSGLDGTVRLWDVAGPRTLLDGELICTQVFKARSARNARMQVTACTAGPCSSSRVFAGCSDGSVQAWDVRESSAHSRPTAVTRQPNFGEVCCVRAAPDAHAVAVRGEAGGVALWDLRMLGRSEEPMWRCSQRIESVADSNLCFSPNGDWLLAGESGPGALHVMRTSTGMLEHSEPLGEVGALVVEWHASLDQIFIGCNDGAVRVLYDPARSRRGVLQSMARAPSKRRGRFEAVVSDYVDPDSIILPNAHPEFRGGHDAARSRRGQGRNKRKLPQAAPAPAVTTTAAPAPEAPAPVRPDTRAELLAHARDEDTDKRPRLLAETTMEEEEERIAAVKGNPRAYHGQ